MSWRRKFPSLTVAAAAAVLALSGCGGDETVVEEAEEAGGAAQVAILGEPVTMQAEVSEILGPNSFTVGADDTLVVHALTATIDEGDRVQVTGTVRDFLVADVEQELGLDFGVDQVETLGEFENELAVVATDVELLPEEG